MYLCCVFKDISGWKKLLAKVGSKCLVVADAALQKGLPLAPNRGQQHPGCRRLSMQQQEGSDEEERRDTAVDKTAEEETAEVEVDPDVVKGLSCAALKWENTLSSTMDKADQLKGEQKSRPPPHRHLWLALGRVFSCQSTAPSLMSSGRHMACTLSLSLCGLGCPPVDLITSDTQQWVDLYGWFWRWCILQWAPFDGYY